MARKNTLFDVDITKENPLITIVNHGKIPVVQINDVPFYNRKVEYLYSAPKETNEERICRYKEIIRNHKEKGLTNITYCNIGGFHGNDFSHWHCPLRNINIGYVEPDELVYDQTSRTYITAARKFQSVKNAWFSLLRKEKEEDIVYGKWSYFNEHFADFQEVWLDSKHIKKVLTVTTDNFLVLLPYVNDGYLSLNCVEDIFHSMTDDLDEKYLIHINETNLEKEWEDKCNRDYEHDYIDRRTFIFDYFWDYTEFYDEYKRKALEEFYRHYSGKRFKYDNDHFAKLKANICNYYTYLKNYKSSNEKIDLYNTDITDFWFSEKYLRIKLRYCKERYSSNVFTIMLNDRSLSVIKGIYYSDYNYSEKEIFLNEVRPVMYEFLIIFQRFCDTFKDLYMVEYPEVLRKLEKYKKLEESLRDKGYDYSVNDIENILTVFEEDFQIEYNLVLKDTVITLPDVEKRYCNIDTLPLQYRSDRMEEIMAILSQEDLANGNG